MKDNFAADLTFFGVTNGEEEYYNNDLEIFVRRYEDLWYAVDDARTRIYQSGRLDESRNILLEQSRLDELFSPENFQRWLLINEIIGVVVKDLYTMILTIIIETTPLPEVPTVHLDKIVLLIPGLNLTDWRLDTNGTIKCFTGIKYFDERVVMKLIVTPDSNKSHKNHWMISSRDNVIVNEPACTLFSRILDKKLIEFNSTCK